jgi:hypothetical protein
MCVPYRLLDPKSRFILGIGNFSLVAALLLRLFVHPSSSIGEDWFDGVSGFLLAFYITINFAILRRQRHGG